MAEPENYLTIKESGNHELIIKKSRFIASCARTKTVAEANVFIQEITKKYHDATHNTYAYVVGPNNEQVKASDNGEPSGTAGVPELKALELMNLRNVTVVVTRYFGGIKLGAGGLIRAYSNSVTQAAEHIGVVKRVLQQEIIFHVAYNRFDEVNHFLTQQKIYIKKVDYGTDVALHIFLDYNELDTIKKALTDLLAGQVTFSNGEKRYNELPVEEHNYHDK